MYAPLLQVLGTGLEDQYYCGHVCRVCAIRPRLPCPLPFHGMPRQQSLSRNIRTWTFYRYNIWDFIPFHDGFAMSLQVRGAPAPALAQDLVTGNGGAGVGVPSASRTLASRSGQGQGY